MLQNKYLQAGVAGIIAFVVFSLTMAPTVSFWDCGEFIASAWSLGIPHPPGTPFFVILARVAMLAFSFIGEKAARVNLVSVLTSAATIYVCYLIVYDSLQSYFLLLKKKSEELKTSYSSEVTSFLTIIGSFLGASLVAFSDTFWFNAVEAEVYGLSMFMVFLITYMSIIWIKYRQDSFGDRLLVLICYVAFLGVGVHLYSMITLPILFVFVAAMDPRMRKSHSAPVWLTAILLYSVVFMVDKFLTVALFSVLVSVLFILIAKSDDLKRAGRLAFWFSIVAIIGYSTHAYIPIRSSLNPVIDENNPEIPSDKMFSPSEWGAFNDFLARKQYGSESMLSRSSHRRGNLANQFLTYPHLGYGGYLIAQLTPFKVGEARVSPSGQIRVSPSENEPLSKFGIAIPTQMVAMGENRLMQFVLFFLLHVLIFYGIYRYYQYDKRYALYLGLLYAVCSFGLVWYMNFADGTGAERADWEHWIKSGKKGDLNRVHMEVRERDYFFTPAFILAAMMMGMSFSIFLKDLWVRKEQLRPWVQKIAFGGLVFLVVIPVYSNYREHDRSGLYVPWDYAYNLINSCEPNSILFTNGDNDTFPLWFIQEVEGIRKDVRVVNLSLGNTPWYVNQILDNEPVKKLKFLSKDPDGVFPIYPQQALSNPQVKSWISTEQFAAHISQKQEEYEQLINAIKLELKNRDSRSKISESDSALIPSALSGKSIKELDQALKKVVPKFQIYDATLDWFVKGNKRVILVQDQLVWDLVNSNPEAPIHFATTVQRSTYLGLEKYMKMDGMVYTLERQSLNQNALKINYEKTQTLVDSVYQYRGLGDGNVYINPETGRLMSNYINIYAKLAFDAIDRALKTPKESEQYDLLSNEGLAYIHLAAGQFPDQYHVYRMGASMYQQLGRDEDAISFLEEGLRLVPEYAKKTLRDQLIKFDSRINLP